MLRRILLLKKAFLNILQKYKLHFSTPSEINSKVQLAQEVITKVQQKRIVVRYGHTIKAIEIEDAAYLYNRQKVT